RVLRSIAWMVVQRKIHVLFMPAVIISVKVEGGLKSLRKTIQMKASLKHCTKQIMVNVCTNLIITWSTIKSSIWNLKMERPQHSACVALLENKPESCKLWGPKVKYAGKWMTIKFRFMIFLLNKKPSLSSINRQVAMVVETVEL